MKLYYCEQIGKNIFAYFWANSVSEIPYCWTSCSVVRWEVELFKTVK